MRDASVIELYVLEIEIAGSKHIVEPPFSREEAEALTDMLTSFGRRGSRQDLSWMSHRERVRMSLRLHPSSNVVFVPGRSHFLHQ